MTTIENEYGTFTADDEKTALAMVRKARMEKRKQEAKEESHRAIAFDRARSNGFNILSRLLSDKTMPRGWMFYPAYAKHVPFETIPGNGRNHCTIRFYGQHGTAVADFYGHDFLGIVENGAGFPIAFFLRDKDRQDVVTSYALGIEENIAAWVEMPTITADMFHASSQTVSQ